MTVSDGVAGATLLVIASRREVRDFTGAPVPRETVELILDAGRLAGSARNRQDRRFVVVERARDAVRAAVTRPANLDRADLVVAIVTGRSRFAGFDAGRAAQSMMLAAWAAGVGSCPNAVADHDVLVGPLGIGTDEQVAAVLTFGIPARPVELGRHTAAAWSARAARRSSSDVTTYA